jgi:hypothetical protein
MTAVTKTTGTVSATAGAIGKTTVAISPNALAIVVPPKAADKKSANVTPICTADENGCRKR